MVAGWVRGCVGALVVALALGASVAPGPASAQTASFSAVDVIGNQRIDADSIRLFAGIQPGQTVTPAQINLAVRDLFATGLFEDVELRPEGGRLIIEVVENPTINFINFEGNRALDNDELLAVIQLRPRRAFSIAAAEADAQRIIDAYQATGRFAAEVTPVIIRQPDNRVDLVFEIFEGRPTQVQNISFVGNRVFSDTRLRRVIQTGQSNILSFIFGGDTFDEARLQRDRDLLRRFYLERGYIDFQVISSTAEVSRERNAFFINFTVEEGEQYRYGRINTVSEIAELDPAAFQPLAVSELRAGRPYNVREVERVIERMEFLAGQQGFAFARVEPEIERDDAANTLDITFRLVQSPRVFVERIDITGNTRTIDRVIRRQFNIVEGDPFNAREIREAEGRIRALGYFSNVSLQVREGSGPDRALVSVNVEEQPTGSLNLGGAFSSSEGFIAQVSIEERNFLGRGQTVRGAISGNPDFRNYEIGFTEPALFDQDLSVGFSLYYRDRQFAEDSYRVTNLGFQPTIGFPLSENGRISLRYRISDDEMSARSGEEASAVIQDELGSLVTSALGFTYSFDRRNSPVDPTAGFIVTVNQDFAGLGGDVQYSRTSANVRAFTSFFDERLVLRGEIEGGILYSPNQTARVIDRFNLGGDSLRGFARAGIGPRDRCGVAGAGDCITGQEGVNDALGGNFYAAARAEATFPLGLPEEFGVFGGVFADVGSVWGLDNRSGSSGQIDDSAELRAAVGVSLLFDTAIAPLRFNYAVPLAQVDGDETERFRFTIQTRF